jgi:hypothetical protein
MLERVEPESTEGDVRWRGPLFIPRPGEWWPTSFVHYRNELYCTVQIGWSGSTLVWQMDEGDVHFERGFGGADYGNGEELWERVLKQVEHRLRGALRNPDAYNRRVARLFPLRCRTGRIRRKLAWPRRARPPLDRSALARLVTALEAGKSAPSWPELSVRRYLETAATAYDVVYPELRELPPDEKYGRKADTRHGGLLDLKPTDAQSFERWFTSREWQGAHPWEIVFAHPHGILLSPHREEDGFRFHLSVDTIGLYVDTARMATALGEKSVPFELFRADEVLDALRGEDWVEVGPFFGQLSLDELEQLRPGATAHVLWDDPPRLLRRGENVTAARAPNQRPRRG